MKSETPAGTGASRTSETVPKPTPDQTLFKSELDALATTANAEHSLAVETANKAISHACKSGEALARARDILGHGNFLPWLESHFSASERTARNYMRVFRNRQRVADLKCSSLREALECLSEPKAPPTPLPRYSWAHEISDSQAMMVFNPTGKGYAIVSPSATPDFFHVAFTDVGTDEEGDATISCSKKPVRRDWVVDFIVICSGDEGWVNSTDVAYLPEEHGLSAPRRENPHGK